jgi:hypothetical protein
MSPRGFLPLVDAGLEGEGEATLSSLLLALMLRKWSAVVMGSCEVRMVFSTLALFSKVYFSFAIRKTPLIVKWPLSDHQTCLHHHFLLMTSTDEI